MPMTRAMRFAASAGAMARNSATSRQACRSIDMRIDHPLNELHMSQPLPRIVTHDPLFAQGSEQAPLGFEFLLDLGTYCRLCLFESLTRPYAKFTTFIVGEEVLLIESILNGD